MPGPGKRLVLCLIVLTGTFGASVRLPQGWTPLSPGPAAASKTQRRPSAKPKPPVQDFGVSLRWHATHRLADGVIHRYRIPLKADELLHARVDQDVLKPDAIDLVVRLYGPDGGRLFEIDSPTRAAGSEEIILHADVPGAYRVEVDGLGGAGTYRIRVLSIRPANAADRINARAERLFYHAREMARKEGAAYRAAGEFLEAERLWRGLVKPKRQAEAFRRAGDVMLAAWDSRRALDLYRQALHFYQVTGNREFEAGALVSIGISSKLLGQGDQAEISYRKAADIADKYGYPDQRADALFNLGVLLRQRGDSWKALAALESALDLRRRLKPRNIEKELDCLLDIGVVFVSLGKYQTAVKYFSDAERLLGSNPAPRIRAPILTRLSELYRRSGDLPRALSYASRALSLRQTARDTRGEAVSLAGMGLIYDAMGDLPRAEDLQERALVVFHRLGDRQAEAIARVNLGFCRLERKDWRTALTHFEQSLLFSRQQQYVEGEMVALYGMARAHRARGNPIEALARGQEVLSLVESLDKQPLDEQLSSVYMRARQGSYDFLIDLLVDSPNAQAIARSFETSDRARWQRLLQSLSPAQRFAGTLRRADPATREARRQLENGLKQNEEVRLELERKGLSTSSAEREQVALMERLHTLDAQMSLGNPWSGSPGRPAAVSLREAQQLLDGDTIALEYHLGDERSFLWYLTRTSAEVFILPARATIEGKARRLYQLLAESQSSVNEAKAIPLARDLSDILLGKVAGRLGKSRLVVVPDGAIHLVPFQMLPDPNRAAERWRKDWPPPLLLTHVIDHLPSLSVLKAIRAGLARRKPAAGLLAVLAGPAFNDPEFSALPHSREEAEAILALVPPGRRSFRALGFEATRDLAMAGQLGNYQMLHFATHAMNHPEYPELSSIILSQVNREDRLRDGKLRLQDIQALDLPADLVVLSACKTALGKDIRGEGFMGLTQGFMYAGAARVVVSLWNVNDESTPAFMERFYRSILVDHKPPSEALAITQRWMSERSPWRSPYYWAGFQIHGEWR
jgi:CHAT domain-containing protein